MEDKLEKLGQSIDSIESLGAALKIPMPPEFHVEQLKEILPDKIKELKEIFVEIAGNNPWE